MSEKKIIQVNNVTKTYKLYRSPGDRVKETFHPLRKKYSHPFNALTDITFHVNKGETLGIVGRNGSGKSTLLQIITRVRTPTAGSVDVDGKIAAILELGSGFNPEFTGRENIYLNSTIMGVSEETINEYIDDIIAFADIGQFIDQPLKVYSSGMKARLAFSLSINVQPDILIIDEALAVGDEAFIRKCYSRIESFRKNGGTVLFVSHGANTIVQLCNRVILLDQGELLLSGSPKHVVTQYQKLLFAPPEKIDALKNEIREMAKTPMAEPFIHKARNGINRLPEKEIPAVDAHYDPNLKPKSTVWYEQYGANIQHPEIRTVEGKIVNNLAKDEEYIFSYQVNFNENAFNVRFGMLFKTLNGLELGGYVTSKMGEGIEYVDAGSSFIIKIRFRCILSQGTYFSNAGVLGIKSGKEEYLHRGIDIIMFRVMSQKEYLYTGLVDFYFQPSIEQM